jgi:hypothetical protein
MADSSLTILVAGMIAGDPHHRGAARASTSASYFRDVVRRSAYRRKRRCCSRLAAFSRMRGLTTSPRFSSGTVWAAAGAPASAARRSIG